jgi:hypothetical protein
MAGVVKKRIKDFSGLAERVWLLVGDGMNVLGEGMRLMKSKVLARLEKLERL